MHIFKVQATGFCADFNVINNHNVEGIKGKARSVDRWLGKRKLGILYKKFGNVEYYWSDISAHIGG